MDSRTSSGTISGSKVNGTHWSRKQSNADQERRALVPPTTLLAGNQAAQTAVGGFDRCALQQFLAVGGRCNRLQEANRLTRSGRDHVGYVTNLLS